MPAPLSMDLRKRIIEARERGDTVARIVREKGVSESAVKYNKTADNTVIAVVKLIEHEDGSYSKRLVYLRSYHGKRLDALADEVRLTYARFPRTVKIVFDMRGLGDAFPQFLSQPWTSPDGKEYPPWVMDDEKSIIHNAVPLLRSVKASAQINQQMVSCLRVALEQRTIEIPFGSRNIQNGKLREESEDEEEAAKRSKTYSAQEKAIGQVFRARDGGTACSGDGERPQAAAYGQSGSVYWGGDEDVK